MITPRSNQVGQVPELNRPLTSLKGIGKKRAELLAQKGLYTVLDLLFFTPIRYEDRSRILPINETGEESEVYVKGNVISAGEKRFFRSGKRLFRIVIEDETAALDLLWFQYRKAHLSRFTYPGLRLMAYGKIQKMQGKRQMIHPDIILQDQGKDKEVLGLYPVYSMVKGISGQVLRSAVRQALDLYDYALADIIPGEITARLGLPGIANTIRSVHFPPYGSSVDRFNRFETKYHQRLIFDRFFHVMLNIAYRKRSRAMRKGPVFKTPKGLDQRLEKIFPFRFTNDQANVIEDILRDLRGSGPMNRLLEGDVGCGKTVVAAVASYVTTLNHRQVAIMVPTQVLARQHYAYFSSLSESMGFRPVLVTGALKRPDRMKINEKINNGEYNLIIGTQALIQEDVSFKRLGLVVIDEQHRFGVRQRALLDKKGINPHLLVMTATPIPRTLAMTVYADLDISVIKEYPEGHLPVMTYLLNENQKRKVFNTVKKRLSLEQQAIVVCPVIEGTEDADLKNVLEMYSKLKKLFTPSYCVGLIHGRLSSDEKDRVMEQFRKGRINLLVGTTVIEVGVHAPGATVMVVEHPERFGLTQLHQLRGRVGRGNVRGLCLLMGSEGLSEKSVSRLKVLVESNDGFEISRKDLEMRGHGELMGIRQAGAGELDLREMFREPELLTTAKEEAEKVLAFDPELSGDENRILKEMVRSFSMEPLDL
ncbi:MAG: ATP-dependent DNA helicase RecG [Deltaproteobacteria bacterium]|nr:ATP-dependent DNA helicase RecG [Deltaproteobacteria bacterium]